MEVTDIVNQLTGGRPYCFVVMPYREMGLFYQHIKRLLEEKASLVCIRADEVPGAGLDLLDKIHQLIARAAVVLADVSKPSANVFYEVGYAVALRKPVLVSARAGAEIPTDLKGLEVLPYDEALGGMDRFDHSLLDHIRLRISEGLPLLRDMLLPETPKPSYIICGPRWPVASLGLPQARRTYGDYLGVIGIINAFGAVIGAGSSPELVTGKEINPELATCDANLFLIAAPKSNDLTASFLQDLHRGQAPCWVFTEPEPGAGANLLGQTGANWKPPTQPPQGSRRQDFGVVVRGPHPKHPRRTVMVMAGQHSLGTGAACLAATTPSIIAQIQSKLPDSVSLDDKHLRIWALVHAWDNEDDRHLDAQDVTVLEAGVYDD